MVKKQNVLVMSISFCSDNGHAEGYLRDFATEDDIIIKNNFDMQNLYQIISHKRTFEHVQRPENYVDRLKKRSY